MSELGELVGDIYVPARSGRTFRVDQGQFLKVTDIQGKQVCDFFAFNPKDSAEMLSPTYTRSVLGQLHLEEGKPLYSNYRRPLLTVVEDRVKKHDLLFAACDPARYEGYGLKDHASCQANVLAALKDTGLTPAIFPHPVNLFQNVDITPVGSLEIREPLSKPGDYIMLQVLEDLQIAVSACPQDQNPCNGWNPTDLRVEVYQGVQAKATPE